MEIFSKNNRSLFVNNLFSCVCTRVSPIKDVVNFSACENRVKQIFLLTDGSVGNTHEIIRVASKAVKPYVNENGQSFPNFYDNRIFTLAIGSGASQSLCRELAMKSHGTMEACDDTDIAEHSGLVSNFQRFRIFEYLNIYI